MITVCIEAICIYINVIHFFFHVNIPTTVITVLPILTIYYCMAYTSHTLIHTATTKHCEICSVHIQCDLCFGPLWGKKDVPIIYYQ